MAEIKIFTNNIDKKWLKYNQYIKHSDYDMMCEKRESFYNYQKRPLKASKCNIKSILSRIRGRFIWTII